MFLDLKLGLVPRVNSTTHVHLPCFLMFVPVPEEPCHVPLSEILSDEIGEMVVLYDSQAGLRGFAILSRRALYR